MMTTVKGHFKNGRIELLEPAPEVGETDVLITFFAASPQPQPSKTPEQGLRFGMFKGPPFSTEQDFKEAEFDEQHFLKEVDDER